MRTQNWVIRESFDEGLDMESVNDKDPGHLGTHTNIKDPVARNSGKDGGNANDSKPHTILGDPMARFSEKNDGENDTDPCPRIILGESEAPSNEKNGVLTPFSRQD